MNRNSLGFAVVLWLLGSCGGDDAASEQICVPGAVDRCSCSDGSEGIRTCTPDGAFDACDCGAEHDSGSPSGSGTPAGASGGDDAAGTGGAGGTGAEPTVADAGAQPPPDGDPPGDGGAPVEQQPPTEDPPPAPDPPAAGELYGPCRSSDDCHDRLQCAGNQAQAFGGSEVGYCAERCLGSSGQGGGSTGGQCTPPETGTTEASCSPFSGVCELGTCERSECPVGMVCEELRLDTRFGLQTVHACAY